MALRRHMAAVAVAIGCLGAPAWAGEPAPLSLDLAACYVRALERSEALGVASAEWRAAEARYRQARDTLWPQVHLDGSGEWNNEGGGGEDESTSSYEVRLRAEQTLYSGFRLTKAAEEAASLGRAAGRDVERFRERFYLDVADAFYQVALDERDLGVLERLAEALRRNAAEVDRRVSLGRSRRAELLQAQAEEAEAQVELEAARGRVAIARELLGFLVGLPADAWRLRDTSPFPEDPGVEAQLARAVSRADVLAAEARLEAARQALQGAQGERKPEVKAEGNVYLLEDPDEGHEWDLLLTFSLPLFDEGVRGGRVLERAERVRVSELNLAALRRQAASDVRAAWVAFLSAAAQRARLREALGVARETHEVLRRDVELGRASQLDELSALARVYRLERREVAAEMQARAGLVRLHVAAGSAAP